MRKKWLLGAVAVAGAMCVMAGCGNGNGSSSGSAQGAETEKGATQTEGGEETVSLRFLDVSPSEQKQKYYEETFARFKEETGISVTYESVPWDDAANRITVLGAAGQLPDVMTVWSGWLGQYTQAGWVIPLESYVNGQEDAYTEAVNKLIWKSEKERYGTIYTIPDGLMVKGIYVRGDWAKEAGIELDPTSDWTYDDYFELVAALTDAQKNRYGASYRGARGALDPLLVYMQSFTGGNTYDQEGHILLNQPEALEAFKKWTDVYLKGYAPEDAINWGFTEMVDNFTGGLTGTLINDSEVAPTCEANMKPEEWMVMPMPKSTADGKIYNTINAPYAYAISGNSQNPDASWKLIEFLSRAENNIEYCKMFGLIPVKKDVENNPTYGLDGPYAAFVRQINDPNLVVPTTFGPFDYTDLHQGMFHEEIQKYLLGNQSAEDALFHITEELESRMQQYMQENPDTRVETASTLE